MEFSLTRIKFSVKEQQLLKELVTATAKYENDDFYAGTDGYRWGRPDGTEIKLRTETLSVIVQAKLVSAGMTEDDADIFLKHLDVLAFCQDLLAQQ
jgi:hypothetical protein